MFSTRVLPHRWCGVCFQWRPRNKKNECAACGTATMMSGGLVDLTSGYDPETDEWYQDPGVLAEGSRKLVDSRSGVKEYDPTTPYEKWLKTDYTPSEVSYKANPDQTSGAQRPSPSR